MVSRMFIKYGGQVLARDNKTSSLHEICFIVLGLNLFAISRVKVTIPCKEIKSITKEKTAKVIPNAVQVNTVSDKYFFSSFTSRDKTYLMMFRVWQNALLSHVSNLNCILTGNSAMVSLNIF